MESPAALVQLEHAIGEIRIPPGSRILVAVSGGPDSVALLTALLRLASQRANDWTVRAAHVNHGLRGDESDEDEDFARRLAASLGVDFVVAQAVVASGGGLEVRARAARYSALEDMLDAWPGDLIATAHTLDDQAETLVMRLLRGAGFRGLGAMERRRGRLVRPFLAVRKETILAALQEQGLDFRIDSSNMDRSFFRNRVRLDVMPVLETARPGSAQVLARAANALGQDADFIAEEARRVVDHLRIKQEEGYLEASTPLWQALAPALQRHTLRILFERLWDETKDLDMAGVERAARVLDDGGQVSLSGNTLLAANKDRFCLRVPVSAERWDPVPLSIPGEALVPAGAVKATVLEAAGDELQRMLNVAGGNVVLIDFESAGEQLHVRPRAPGDRLRPLGVKGTRKLQDVLTDRKVPRDDRDLVPVVDNGSQIVWVAGIALDERAAARPSSKRVVRLLFEPKSS